MLRILIVFLTLSFTATELKAQLPSPDKIKTENAELTIQPIFHAAIILHGDNKTIYIDPYNGAKAYEGMPAPDLILITDIHGDHLDTVTLAAINTSKAKFIVPKAVADKMPAQYKSKLLILNNGENTEQSGIPISAIAMYNLPESPDAMHTKGRGNGYILTIGGKKIYISGDTEDITEMRNLKNIDIAFICMNQPYTMTVEQASNAVLQFKPKVVYPYHYRGKDGFSDVDSFKKIVNKGSSSIDVRLRNWYAK